MLALVAVTKCESLLCQSLAKKSGDALVAKLQLYTAECSAAIKGQWEAAVWKPLVAEVQKHLSSPGPVHAAAAGDHGEAKKEKKDKKEKAEKKVKKEKTTSAGEKVKEKKK